MDMKASELLTYLGSIVGVITVAQTMMRTLLPPPLRDLFCRLFERLREHFTRYHYVDVPENDESWLANELYGAIKLHLSDNAVSYTQKAKRVKLFRTSTSAEFTWSPARNETVEMTFRGTKVWWEHHISTPRPQSSHLHQPWLGRADTEEKRKYTLRVHKKDKTQVIAPYMEHIIKQAMELKHNNRTRLLYTNGKGGGYMDSYRALWDFVPFKHPSTFETLAMDPVLKQKIQDDLLAFASGQEYYKKTGRAWKRGYLLHGPPGTGKSSLIGAMANFLRYDVYDLELTQVRSNGDLRKMLLRTTSKSIIVIEDIDCSLDLANNRGNRSSSSSSSSRKRESRNEDGRSKDDETGSSTITLSGLLNFTDGLWSCCGEERIFVFTTNHVENLDPALLRPGRMDMHILMSYCTYPAFEILAENYLCLNYHRLFPKVQEILDKAHITPAEVSEVFMRRRDEPDIAMEELMVALEVAKAKPWPPPLPSRSVVAKKATVEEMAEGEDVEEVKKALDVSEKVNEAEKKGCARCACRCREERSSVISKRYGNRHEREKVQEECVEKKESLHVEEDDGVCMVDKGQMAPSKNKKAEKAE